MTADEVLETLPITDLARPVRGRPCSATRSTRWNPAGC